MNPLQKLNRLFACSCLGLSMLALSGCATTPATPTDYSAFQRSDPRSILVLPPLNETVDVKGEAAVFAQVSFPLAESGYYVFPVGLVNEVFRENGIHQAAEAHNVPAQKLIDIFGADTALYLTIKEYGTAYKIVSGDAAVTIAGQLVDLKTGELIWKGEARASSAEQNSNSSGGLAGLLVKALVNQIINSLTDRTYSIADIASRRLLTAQSPRGLLFGPRSPFYTGKRVAVNTALQATVPLSPSSSSVPPLSTSAQAPAMTASVSRAKTETMPEPLVSPPSPVSGPNETIIPQAAPAPVTPPPAITPPPALAPATPQPTPLAAPQVTPQAAPAVKMSAPVPTLAPAATQAPTQAVAPEAAKPNNTYQPAVREIVQAPAEKSNIQLVEFVLGVSSLTVERLAKSQSCVGGNGAGLVSPKGSRELYKMKCDDGKTLMAKCELRQCSILSHR